MQTIEKSLSAFKPLPWQTQQWQNYTTLILQNKCPHALLLSGIDGLGKHHFAFQLAAFALCSGPKTTVACGQCDNCHLMHSGNHPDFMCLEAEGKSGTIKVDTIRGCQSFTTQTPLYGGYKVVLIDPADGMNMAACNSLLKTLEEPSGKSLFLLVTAMPIQLPATVRSRCQMVKFTALKTEETLAFVQSHIEASCDAAFMMHLAHHAPLKAIKLADPEQLSLRKQFLLDTLALLSKQADPISAAKAWYKADLAWILQNLYALLMDLVKLSLDINTTVLYHTDFAERLRALVPGIRQSQLLTLQDKVQSIYQSSLEKLNLNSQLLLEDLFIELSQRLTHASVSA